MATPWGQVAVPVPTASVSSSEWVELKAAGISDLNLAIATNWSIDGRSYYYHGRTNTTQWEKPDALKTPAEVRLSKIPWKEYTTPEGRKYWHNGE